MKSCESVRKFPLSDLFLFLMPQRWKVERCCFIDAFKSKMNSFNPFNGYGFFTACIKQRVVPFTRSGFIPDKQVNPVQSKISHRIKVLFVCIPSLLEARYCPVKPRNIASLKSYHARLTPCKRKSSDEQASEHQPGLSTAQHNQCKES